jgi:hypothetical protein
MSASDERSGLATTSAATTTATPAAPRRTFRFAFVIHCSRDIQREVALLRHAFYAHRLAALDQLCKLTASSVAGEKDVERAKEFRVRLRVVA